jgi:hypothetical protein
LRSLRLRPDRFKVMADWAKFLRGEDASNVVPLRRGAAGE